MDIQRIAELLKPFLASAREPNSSAALSQQQLEYISTYVDILLRWNARMNLTAVRDPEGIVTRHFGESLFAARYLLGANGRRLMPNRAIVDVGSGAGFPGLPLKIWDPNIELTLIESNLKKSTFLREVCRSLGLTDVEVFTGRVQEFFKPKRILVTMRAVEHFDEVLPIAAQLVAPFGRLALLIGESQVAVAQKLVTGFTWNSFIALPQSNSRVLLVGEKV